MRLWFIWKFPPPLLLHLPSITHCRSTFIKGWQKCMCHSFSRVDLGLHFFSDDKDGQFLSLCLCAFCRWAWTSQLPLSLCVWNEWTLKTPTTLTPSNASVPDWASPPPLDLPPASGPCPRAMAPPAPKSTASPTLDRTSCWSPRKALRPTELSIALQSRSTPARWAHGTCSSQQPFDSLVRVDGRTASHTFN